MEQILLFGMGINTFVVACSLVTVGVVHQGAL